MTTPRSLPVMPSFFAGQKLTGTLLNQVGTFGTFWADAPTVRAYQSVTQNLTSGTDTQITLDTKLWDTDGFWQGSTPYNIVIPAGWGSGLRMTFSFSAAFASNATGSRAVYIKKNGSRVTGSTDDGASNNDIVIINGTASVIVNSGDTIALWAWQNSGSTLSTTTTADTSWIEGWLRGTGNP